MYCLNICFVETVMFRCIFIQQSELNETRSLKILIPVKLNIMKIFLPLVVVLTTIVSASCSKKIAFYSSSAVPAAEGNVKVKKDNNNNYSLDIKVRHLAPSKNLTPPMEFYVVWIETESNGIKNVGQINSSGGLLSKTLKASLKTVTSFKPKSVFITAENNAAIQYPGSVQILKTSSFSIK